MKHPIPHTPGPWHIKDFGSDVRVWAGDQNIARSLSVPGPGRTNARVANAHLMAAAPELLQMVNDLLLLCQNPAQNADDEATRTYTLANATRLIARAKGETDDQTP